MHAAQVMMAEEVTEQETSAKSIAWQVFLVLAPWLVFWLMDEVCGGHVALILFEILLIAGVVVAWRHKFPVWSYTWIGTLYFFVYRELFEAVIMLAPKIVPDNPDLIINGFYLVVNPLALAFLLALITRRDWLLACFTAYPYTSIIQAWYTLDNTPFHILFMSLVLYGLFAFLFILTQSRTLKFVSLLAGTLLIGVGFYLYNWDALVEGLRGFLYMSGRLLLIILFPLLIYRIPLYRKLFRCGQLDAAVSADKDSKTI